jgi:hypothetical protein
MGLQGPAMGSAYKSGGRSGNVLEWSPEEWSLWIWWLHALAAYYVAGFVWFFFAFRRDERRARSGGPEDIERYNLRLRGFPNSGYAKMLGRRALREETPSPQELPP